jgi:hypothetical protein
LVGELPVAEGTLMDVWKMCLHMEGSQDRVVRPEGTIDAEVVTGKLWVLGHVLGGISRVGLICSVVLVDVYLKGGTADELLGALREGALMVMWDACVEGS